MDCCEQREEEDKMTIERCYFIIYYSLVNKAKSLNTSKMGVIKLD